MRYRNKKNTTAKNGPLVSTFLFATLIGGMAFFPPNGHTDFAIATFNARIVLAQQPNIQQIAHKVLGRLANQLEVRYPTTFLISDFAPLMVRGALGFGCILKLVLRCSGTPLLRWARPRGNTSIALSPAHTRHTTRHYVANVKSTTCMWIPSFLPLRRTPGNPI